MIRFEECLHASARRDPQRVAIVCRGTRTSYAQLAEQVERFAARLADCDGFQRGARCVLFLDNRLETAIGLLGTLRAGGVFSVLNPTTKADKLAYVLNNCEATVLITQASLLGVTRAALNEVSSVRRLVVVDGETSADGVSWNDFMAQAVPDLPPTPQGIDIDLAMLVYTSGSTGRPKGVMMTHRNVVFAATSITRYLEMRREDVVLSVLPLAFDYGLYQLLMCVLCGNTLVLEKSFAFPQKILPLLASESVSGFPLVPTMAALIVQLRNFDPQWANSVRFLTNTAAALPPDISSVCAQCSSMRVFIPCTDRPNPSAVPGCLPNNSTPAPTAWESPFPVPRCGWPTHTASRSLQA